LKIEKPKSADVVENTIEESKIALISNKPGESSLKAEMAKKTAYKIMKIIDNPIQRVFHCLSSNFLLSSSFIFVMFSTNPNIMKSIALNKK